MQVASPTPQPSLNTLSPTRKTFNVDDLGSSERTASPLNASPRRLRRSLRLSAATGLTPQHALNKENLDSSPINQPSTSAKTLDIALSEGDKSSMTQTVSPFAGNPARNASPLRSRSSPLRQTSPLRRNQILQSDDIVSSSDESDDSTLVFFGKPSSAEKKKRMHYEQRVLEKRLKHKDSLDLARRRPINFNPDDTMLVDDQTTYGWSWSKPTPTPLRSAHMLLSFPTLSPDALESPTRSRNSSTRPSSPDPLTLQPEPQGNDEKKASPTTDAASTHDGPATQEGSPEAQQQTSTPEPPQKTAPMDGKVEPESAEQKLEQEIRDTPEVNPFIAAQTTIADDSPAKSPSKQRQESRRAQSPVRSVETLIGATMAHNRDFVSPMRSPRRSPRLLLRALPLSTSPTKSTSGGLFFGPSTPFQQALASQKATPLLHSTPFQPPTAASLPPPSTGLSRFACLQNLAPAVPATPSTSVLARNMAQPMVLPSPFISGPVFPIDAAGTHPSPSRTPSRSMHAPSPVKQTRSPQKQAEIVSEPFVNVSIAPRSASPSKAAQAPATPSVRFAEPEPLLYQSPSRSYHGNDAQPKVARSSSPVKLEAGSDVSRSPQRAEPQLTPQSTPVRISAAQELGNLATPPQLVADNKLETPGPVFRQTARRVPIHQHEADFGVKVSPEKPSYSPRRGHANSSARTNDFGVKPERIPARRVPVQPAPASRQNVAKPAESSGTSGMRLGSVASKAARAVSAGSGRIGGQNTSLPAAALSRTASATATMSRSEPVAGAAPTQPAQRPAATSQGPSVASKANRLQRPASAVFGTKQTSPSKQARSLSGLPRPKSASAAASSAAASGPGSRLPRPATLGATTTAARPTTRPVPMAIARLAPAQQGLQRSAAGLTTSRTQTATVPTEAKAVSVSPSSGSSASDTDPKSDVVMEDAGREPIQEAMSPAAAEADSSPSGKAGGENVQKRPAMKTATAATAPRAEPDAKVQAQSFGSSQQLRAARPLTRAAETAPASSSSPNMPAPPAKPPSSARSAPQVVLDPEQQRLRCLAMQEKARKRAPKTSSSVSALTSSDVEDLPSSETAADESSPQDSRSEQAQTSAMSSAGLRNGALSTSGGTTLASPESEGQDIESALSALGGAAASALAPQTATTTGRPLRSTRTASRQLTPSATRVPPTRGRTLSLNDIIAARKIDVPLSLTDQLRLADTVNKKHNEKTLARYKVTKIQRPYERPPSPDRHDHEPEACTIIDDFSSHRKGKGDLAPYSTPVKSSYSATNGSVEGRKCVRWYRPLFVGKGAQYGTRACEAKPALKPIRYELDRMGNKVPTGNSPKLSKGQSIVIYRNYFKGEPEPADD